MAGQFYHLWPSGRANLCLLIGNRASSQWPPIPPRPILLSSAYHLLHQVAEKLLLGEPISNLGGTWWFINMWLNAHMHKCLQWNFAQQFPRDIAEDYELAEDESATRSPLNYGEAIIVLPGTDVNENQIGRFFQTLYNGLSRDHQAWMPYVDEESRFPLLFHPADEALNKDNDLMMAIITARAILVNSFGSGKNSSPTYEFYNPSALARQLAFGQLPIRLCYADVVKPRETITSGLEWLRIAQLQPNADTTRWRSRRGRTRAVPGHVVPAPGPRCVPAAVSIRRAVYSSSGR